MTREEEIKKIALCYAHDELKDNHGDVEDIVASAFIDGANYADSHPRWISVEDELPKNDCYILVTSRGVVHHWRYGVLESADVLKNVYGITHWMPFPQPPKKGGEE